MWKLKEWQPLCCTLIVVMQISVVASLQCYQCSNVNNISECQNLVQCSNTEQCFTTRSGSGDTAVYTLGCQSQNKCDARKTIVPKAYDVVTGECVQCCSSDACNTRLCAYNSRVQRQVIDGHWSNWNTVGSCDVTCGTGMQQRIRTCTNPAPSGGLDCAGLSKDTQPCHLNPCPSSGADGGWSSLWSNWLACSASCNGGLKTRSRTCTKPIPSGLGRGCVGTDEEKEICNSHNCPVTNGGWSTWAAWTACSSSCGGGIRTKARLCNHPAPSQYGSACDGDYHETSFCNGQACPATDGGWSLWTVWKACSASCNGGLKTRSRTCTNPPPSALGKGCIGSDEDKDICNNQNCPERDGGWSLWTQWNACSASCNGGLKTRSRTCTNPPPSVLGKGCIGSDEEKDICNNQNCPVTNGGWSLWATWTACSSSCGGGIQTRARLCNNPIPSQFGSACDGDYHETRFCSARACPVPVVVFSVTQPTDTLVGGSKSEGRPAFTRIITNIGNGYDNTTGYFHAPVAGIYHFAFSFTTGTTYRTSCLLEDNYNHIVETSVSHQSSKIPASTSTYLKLRTGEQVNIYCYGWEMANHDLTMIFNGALISPI